MSALPAMSSTLPLARSRTDEGALRIETIADAAAFGALRDEWTELLEASRSDSLFLTWEWLHTWWTHLSGDARLAILAVRRGERLVALAPFTSRTNGLAGRLGVPRLEFLGTGAVGSDYLDVILRPGSEREALQALAGHVARQGALLDMRQVRLTASGATELARELKRSGSTIGARRTHLCPFIDLRARSWEAYVATLGVETRHNFLRRLKKLEKDRQLRFECVDSEERRREMLPVLFDLHQRRWSEKGGSDGLQGAGILAFHEDMSRLALERGWLRLFVLWLDGTPAATLYGFRYGSVFNFYQSGFDPRYGKLSVGMVTLGLAIRSAIQDGAAEFDLLHGTEAYKFHWASRVRRLGRITAYPAGLLGGLCRSAEAARPAARRVLGMLPGGLAARISAARGAAARRREERSHAAQAG